MVQVGIYLSCYKSHTWKYSKIEKTILTGMSTREGIIPAWKDNLEAIGVESEVPQGGAVICRVLVLLSGPDLNCSEQQRRG